MSFQHIRVLPHIGPNYGNQSSWGFPILIVGESHYSNRGNELSAEFTRRVVQEVIQGYNNSFFTKTTGVFYGSWPDLEARRRFWNEVAFYNFIQETVGDRARLRPTDNMWQKAKPAFEELLLHCRPDFVLVLGKQLWDNLPVHLEKGPMVTLPDGQSRASRLYFNDNGYAFTFGINHPASRRWNYTRWTPWVQTALREATIYQRRKPPISN